jgi:hypothetical protein
MKFLVFSDLHATEGAERCFHNPTLPLQRYRVSLFLEKLKAIFLEEKCQGILDLGDTTEDRASIPMPTISSMLPQLQQFQGSAARNFKLLGNHEQYEKSGLVHSGPLYAGIFYVINNLATIELDDCNLVAASFPADESYLTQQLKQIATTDLDLRECPLILIGHFQVAGATMNSGPSLTGLRLDVLKSFDLVLLGHVHLGQSLAPNVHYVGSPFQQNFGESGQLKRVAILDTVGPTVTFIEITGLPMYHVTSLESFLGQFDPAAEDRYRVVLKNWAEVERFFAHPYANRATPIFQFNPQAEHQARSGQSHSWILPPREVLMSFAQRYPPQLHGINMPLPELVDLGLQLAEAT